MALVLVFAGRYLGGGRAGVPRWWAQLAFVFLAGVGVLAGGLVVFGRDGMMAHRAMAGDARLAPLKAAQAASSRRIM